MAVLFAPVVLPWSVLAPIAVLPPEPLIVKLPAPAPRNVFRYPMLWAKELLPTVMTPADADVVAGSARLPARLMLPATSSFWVGALVPIPTLPTLVMIIRSTSTLMKRSEGLTPVAPGAGRTLKNPAPTPKELPAYP